MKATSPSATDRDDVTRPLELLAPARDADIAIEAILHGADAVYIGAPSHGARKSAANSLDDLRRVVAFAHIFRSRVYCTVNTIVYERELKDVERLISDLYRIGVDAIIVQDMGILRLDIPPIELHASTQCDIRTPQKARFLEEAGFSQLVLARELGLEEVRAICDEVSVPVETFVHGALCVSYSGRCHASQVLKGRSANRGECAQICRLPYTLTDARGRVLARDNYLLSLRDFNLSHQLPELIEAGASSFKIEGRLKDVGYVKNVTAYYSAMLDRVVVESGGKYRRVSSGRSEIGFDADPQKSFNRGFTNYFLKERRPASIASLNTPKSLGEPVQQISQLHPGDGVAWFDRNGEYTGALVNAVGSNGISLAGGVRLPKNVELRLTRDNRREQRLLKPTAERKISLSVRLCHNRVEATDERGISVAVAHSLPCEEARKPFDPRSYFEKLGSTPYRLDSFVSELGPMTFIPASALSALRRQLIAALDRANVTTYSFGYRRPENVTFPYPEKNLIFADNVANPLAAGFYRDHGVSRIEPAVEAGAERRKGMRLMTCRHCILRELGRCKREHKPDFEEPLILSSGAIKMQLGFDCPSCEMHLLSV